MDSAMDSAMLARSGVFFRHGSSSRTAIGQPSIHGGLDVDASKFRSYGVGADLASNYTVPYWKIFGGQREQRTVCNHCLKTCRKPEFFEGLSLNIPSKTGPTLEGAIAAYLLPEQLLDDSDVCLRCWKQGQRVRQWCITSWPKVLFVHVSRWTAFLAGQGHADKDSRHLAFPRFLDLPSAPLYALRSMVVHESRLADNGHYYSYSIDESGTRIPFQVATLRWFPKFSKCVFLENVISQNIEFWICRFLGNMFLQGLEIWICSVDIYFSNPWNMDL